MLHTYFTTQQEPQLQHLIPQNWTQVTNNQQNIQLQFTSNSQNALSATKKIAIYCLESKFAEDRRKIKRFPLASKLRTIASGNQVAFLCELLMIASACTFPAVTWYFCYFC